MQLCKFKECDLYWLAFKFSIYEYVYSVQLSSLNIFI